MLDLTAFGFSSEYQTLFATVDHYSREELFPLSERMDREDWFPEEQLRALAGVGLLGTTAAEEDGGAGLDFLGQCVVAEAMGYWNHAFTASWMSSENVCLHNIVRNGSPEQRKRFLPRFARGEWIGALGLTETGAGSDALGGMRTTAIRKGDRYVLNGRKMFITNAPVADAVLVYARTDPDQGNRGISAFLVEKAQSPFECVQEFDKMGWRGSPTGELLFENCEVPAENRIGPENGGAEVAMSGLNLERIIMSFYNLAVAQRALDLSVDYAKTREQFGQPIGQFQLVQGMLADMFTELEAARAFTYQVGRELAREAPGGAGAGDHKRAAAAMLQSARMANRVFDHGVQIHGGTGFMRESEINRLYRCGKLLEIGAGTNQIRQLIIARELLK
jgi:isovaleryl-CoA dehydrogenase